MRRKGWGGRPRNGQLIAQERGLLDSRPTREPARPQVAPEGEPARVEPRCWTFPKNSWVFVDPKLFVENLSAPSAFGVDIYHDGLIERYNRLDERVFSLAFTEMSNGYRFNTLFRPWRPLLFCQNKRQCHRSTDIKFNTETDLFSYAHLRFNFVRISSCLKEESTAWSA